MATSALTSVWESAEHSIASLFATLLPMMVLCFVIKSSHQWFANRSLETAVWSFAIARSVGCGFHRVEQRGLAVIDDCSHSPGFAGVQPIENLRNAVLSA